MWTIIPTNKYDEYLYRYPSLNDFKEEIKLCEENNLIFLPRWFYKNYPAKDLLYFHEDLTWQSKDITTNFIGQLKPEQYEIISPFIEILKDKNKKSGILKARPGAGKTVMSIYLGCLAKKKVLINIDNSNLLKQWVKSIYEFTDLKNDISIDPEILNNDDNFTPQMAKKFGVGIIQGDIFDTNYPFTIAMVQTLVSRSKKDIMNYYEKIKEAGFGTWFFDECHKTVSGPKYAIASLFSNTKNMIGLSATPYANGLQDILMANTIGNIISDTKYYDLKPQISIIKFNSQLDETYKPGYILNIRDYLKRRARWNKISTESTVYLKLIYDINKRLIENNHRIINIAFTQNQVKVISEYLENNNLINRQFYSKQRKINKSEDNILVATYSFAGTGFDFKELSACLIVSPLSGKKSLIQVIGRILREHESKQAPRVFILMDTAFQGIFSKDINRIKNILNEEFSCDIKIHELI